MLIAIIIQLLTEKHLNLKDREFFENKRIS